jgi:hypothetical protein
MSSLYELPYVFSAGLTQKTTSYTVNNCMVSIQSELFYEPAMLAMKTKIYHTDNKGISPLWVLIWALSLSRSIKDFPQVSQMWYLPSS